MSLKKWFIAGNTGEKLRTINERCNKPSKSKEELEELVKRAQGELLVAEEAQAQIEYLESDECWEKLKERAENGKTEYQYDSDIAWFHTRAKTRDAKNKRDERRMSIRTYDKQRVSQIVEPYCQRLGVKCFYYCNIYGGDADCDMKIKWDKPVEPESD